MLSTITLSFKSQFLIEFLLEGEDGRRKQFFFPFFCFSKWCFLHFSKELLVIWWWRYGVVCRITYESYLHRRLQLPFYLPQFQDIKHRKRLTEEIKDEDLWNTQTQVGNKGCKIGYTLILFFIFNRINVKNIELNIKSTKFKLGVRIGIEFENLKLWNRII